MKLETVVPWGRSLDEYRAMFGLRDDDLKLSILGCGDGPASFNAQWTALGGHVTSVDPIYQFAAEEIRRRVEETYHSVVEQTPISAHRFVWTRFQDADDLGHARLEAAEAFLADFNAGREAGRYQAQSLPKLDFQDNAFELGLCSHLLFLYSEQLDLDFHLASMRELLRVCRTVRVFPLLDLSGERCKYLQPVVEALREDGFRAEVRRVNYEFQHGGNEMLTASPGA